MKENPIRNGIVITFYWYDYGEQEGGSPKTPFLYFTLRDFFKESRPVLYDSSVQK